LVDWRIGGLMNSWIEGATDVRIDVLVDWWVDGGVGRLTASRVHGFIGWPIGGVVGWCTYGLTD